MLEGRQSAFELRWNGTLCVDLHREAEADRDVGEVAPRVGVDEVVGLARGGSSSRELAMLDEIVEEGIVGGLRGGGGQGEGHVEGFAPVEPFTLGQEAVVGPPSATRREAWAFEH